MYKALAPISARQAVDEELQKATCRMTPFETTTALLNRRMAGDKSPTTYKEAKALRKMQRRMIQVDALLHSEYPRFERKVTLSPYMRCLLGHEV